MESVWIRRITAGKTFSSQFSGNFVVNVSDSEQKITIKHAGIIGFLIMHPKYLDT